MQKWECLDVVNDNAISYLKVREYKIEQMKQNYLLWWKACYFLETRTLELIWSLWGISGVGACNL